MTVQPYLRALQKRIDLARQALRLIFAAAGKWTVIWFVLLLIQGLIPGALVYMTKWLVDAIAAAIGGGATWDQAMVVLVPAGIVGGLMLLQRVLGGFNSYVNTAQAELVGDHIKRLIHEKAVEVDYGFYESDLYYDLMEQANSQASSRTLGLLRNLGSLVQGGVTFLSIAVILIQYTVWLPLILAVGTLPAFLVLIRYNRKYHAWWTTVTADRRRAQYYDLMLTSQQAAAEVRINNLGDYFKDHYQAIRGRLRGERLKLLRDQAIAGFGAGLAALAVLAAMLGWIGLRALQGQATLGDLALFYQAFNQGQSVVGGLFNNVGQVYTNTLFLEHLYQLLDQVPDLRDPEAPQRFPKRLQRGVTFEDLTFAYPGTERPALKDFNLHIPARKITAIVGENGAGKSTLIKLLCRFYDPDEGRVLIDGMDLRAFSKEDVRRHLSVMFQFPMKYQFTARQNITLGDIRQESDPAEVEAAATNAGAHHVVEKLPKRYEALLGRWFAEGVELSGGEWQRMALARAYYRQAPLLILDEPTNHMDTWSEAEWLTRFKHLVDGRTALFITHRFTTAMHADIIHVMDEGELVESGTHEELLARGGHYATAWRAQMQQEGEEVAEAPQEKLPEGPTWA